MLRWVSPVLSSAAAALITGAVVATAAPGDVNVSSVSTDECVVITPPIVLPTVTVTPTPTLEESSSPTIDASPEPTTTAEPTESASPTAP